MRQVTKMYSLHTYYSPNFKRDNVLATRTAAKINHMVYNLRFVCAILWAKLALPPVP
jgi:hypothetical protein